jgi:small subunit ribosomal protein S3Ae
MVKSIRRKMNTILMQEAAKSTVTEFVRYLLTDSPGEAITKACKLVFPLTNVVVRKVKMLKKPKLDITKLEDLYKENITTEAKAKRKDKKQAIDNTEESKNLLSA